MGGVVGAHLTDHGDGQAVEDAAVFGAIQAQADIPCLNLAAQRLARRHRLVGHAHVQRRIRQLQGEQLVVGVIGADAAFDHYAGVIAQRQGQVEARQCLADRAASQRLALAEQYDVVGQLRHFILGMADVQHRNVQFIVQPLQVRQDFAFALGVQCRQRLVHQQQFGAGEQGTSDTDTLSLSA
ncbi:hypothetical protein D3C87_1060320 [compost metagenome]